MRTDDATSSFGSSTALNDRRLAWLLTALVWVCLLIAYRNQVALIVEAWETLPSHAHGYVVLVVVAFLAWGKRAELVGVPLAPSRTGFCAFLLSCAAGFAGEMVSAGVVVQFALVFMLQTAVWTVMGTAAFRVLFGPLCFLLFAIPFGHDVLPTLMDWTANATVLGLRASGVPVFQQDRLFIIPSGSWSVVEACSGIRYLLTSFFVGSIFAYITYTRWHKRLIFIVWMLLLSLLANWMRAYVIVMAAHLSNNQWGLGLSHLTFGWIIFAVTILISFWVGVRWQDTQKTIEVRPLASAARARVTLVAALLTAVVGAGSALAASRLLNLPDQPLPVLDFSNSLAGLEKVQPALPMITPRFVGASAIHEATYRFENGQVGLTVAYYRNQRQGAELANVHNLIEPTRGWTWGKSRRLASFGEGIPKMRSEHYVKGNAHAVAASVYWVGGWTTTSDIVSKIYQAINLVTGKGDDGAMLVITATTLESDAAADTLVQSFVRNRVPGLLEDLRRIQAGE